MINIVLFEPEIPQNTGNIMRTCVATNSTLHLIRPFGFNINDRNLKRSAVNYTDKLKFIMYDDYDDFKSKNKGEFYYFTRYGNKNHSSITYNKTNNIYLIFGKESNGIPKNILKNNIDNCIRIPMSDNVRAMNLSNSVAIATYEVLRQFGYDGLFNEEPHKGKNYLIE